MIKQVFIQITTVAAAAFTLLLAAGCAVNEMPADITLDELEEKMARAMDPNQTYRNAQAYFQRQNIEEEELFGVKHQLVEVRFQRPDKFKLSYYKKHNAATEIVSANGRAWLVNHEKGVTSEITGTALAKVKIMLALGHPDTDYDKLFKRVDMSLVELEDDRQYYKLVCHVDLAKSHPIIIYIDRTDYLPKRMIVTVNTPDGEVHSESFIEQYQKFNDITVPALTRVKEGTREYTTRVVGYQLNSPFDDGTFQVPEFDPVLQEIKKQKSRRR